MTSLLHRDNHRIERSDLEEAGFTEEQIKMLEDLRATYPFRDYFDSRKELQRLRFMKWMIGREQATDS
ncbi:MAG TPA: hypothetical protein VKZ96_18325 [Thermomicrobiales bacterium]|nr:hypothetical protein [Thermomicrobiales bacterium]